MKKNILLLLSICILITGIWFRYGKMFAGGEDGIILQNPQRSLELSESVWVDSQLGFPTTTYLSRVPMLEIASLWYKFGLSMVVFQVVLFLVFLSTGVMAFYYLVRNMFSTAKEKEVLAFISAIFYFLNPFTMSQIFGRGLYTGFFTFAFFPLGLYLYSKALKIKPILYTTLFLIASFFFAHAFAHPAFILTFWSALFILFTTQIISNRKNTRNLIKIFLVTTLFFAGWMLINSWWVLPLVFEEGQTYATQLSLDDNLPSLLGVSSYFTFGQVIRLIQKYYFFDPGLFGSLYGTVLFQSISIIYPITMLIGIYQLIRKRANVYFLLLFLLGLFVSLGVNPPLGNAFVFLFKKISIFQVLRNPYEKYGIVYMMGYSVLFSIGIVTLLGQKIKKGILKKSFLIFTILFFCFGIYLWPLWTGVAVHRIDKLNVVEVPKAYSQMNLYISGLDEKPQNVLVIPYLFGDGLLQDWEYGYNGMDTTPFLFNFPIFSRKTPQTLQFNKYIPNSDVLTMLSYFRANYILYRDDTLGIEDKQIEYFTDGYYQTQGFISKNPMLCKNIEYIGTSYPRVICDLSKNSNWGNPIFFYVLIESNTLSNLEIALTDSNGIRPRWDWTTNKDFLIGVNKDPVIIKLPTSTATEYYSDFDFQNVRQLEAILHPIEPITQPVKIKVFGVQVDPGEKIKVDEYEKIKTIDNLTLYKVKNIQPAPLIGTYSEVRIFSNEDQVFENTRDHRRNTTDNGFIVETQNQKKNLNYFTEKSEAKLTDWGSGAKWRYWLEIDGENKKFIVLNRRFNPSWKLIKGVGKKYVKDRTFSGLIKLIQSDYLRENDHFLVNGYSNIWVVDDKTQNYLIVYRPQLFVDLGWKLTNITLIASSTVSIFYTFRENKKAPKE